MKEPKRVAGHVIATGTDEHGAYVDLDCLSYFGKAFDALGGQVAVAGCGLIFIVRRQDRSRLWLQPPIVEDLLPGSKCAVTSYRPQNAACAYCGWDGTDESDEEDPAPWALAGALAYVAVQLLDEGVAPDIQQKRLELVVSMADKLIRATRDPEHLKRALSNG